MPFSRISPLSSPADPPPSEPNDMRALERSEMEERGKERDALTAPLRLTVPNRRCLLSLGGGGGGPLSSLRRDR